MMPKPDQRQDEENLVPVSALQHYLFCPRQCALIHIEQQWAENGATVEGRLLHERVDSGVPDRKRGVRTLRTLPIRSFALGIYGKADAVELHGTGSTLIPYPVEYKRGSPKPHHADEVQLCAQALCLEEMFGCAVSEGALFYDRPHRRTTVQFDQGLRDLTQKTAQKVQDMLAAGKTPQPVWNKGCKHCSLEAICQPRRLEKPLCVEKWFLENLED